MGRNDRTRNGKFLISTTLTLLLNRIVLGGVDFRKSQHLSGTEP